MAGETSFQFDNRMAGSRQQFQTARDRGLNLRWAKHDGAHLHRLSGRHGSAKEFRDTGVAQTLRRVGRIIAVRCPGIAGRCVLQQILPA
jgi:hypothetical protein